MIMLLPFYRGVNWGSASHSINSQVLVLTLWTQVFDLQPLPSVRASEKAELLVSWKTFLPRRTKTLQLLKELDAPGQVLVNDGQSRSLHLQGDDDENKSKVTWQGRETRQVVAMLRLHAALTSQNTSHCSFFSDLNPVLFTENNKEEPCVLLKTSYREYERPLISL